MRTKGLIAVDIDGTLTNVPEELPQEVISYLHKVYDSGWKLLFVTGRTLYWASKLLHKLPIDFYLAAFNGAYVVEFRPQIVLKRSYLSLDDVYRVIRLVHGEDAGIAFYGAPDIDNRSFLYINNASRIVQNHLFERATVVKDPWTIVNELQELSLDAYSAIRLFCLPHIAKKLGSLIEEETSLHAPMMKDSYNDSFSVVQITHREVSKGHALTCVVEHLGKVPKIIACGDDYNDISMLKLADIAVVMADAPTEVLSLADIIAPPVTQNGIITGLTRAIHD